MQMVHYEHDKFTQNVNIGLGAKSENLSFVAPPGKRNSIDIMC